MGVVKMLLLTMLALGAPLAMAGLLLGGSIGTPGIDHALDELNSAVADAARIFDSDPPTVGRAVDGDAATQDPGTASVTTSSSPEPGSPAVLYIGKTGGYGVALRSSCADDARLGTAWPDNTAVEMVTQGAGECDGWRLVASGGVESWVRSGFLLDAPLGTTVTSSTFGAPETPPRPAATQPPTDDGN